MEVKYICEHVILLFYLLESDDTDVVQSLMNGPPVGSPLPSIQMSSSIESAPEHPSSVGNGGVHIVVILGRGTIAPKPY